MISNVTTILENNIKSLMGNFAGMYLEAKNIYDFYWDTDVNTIISGLATSATGATVSSKLTKGEFTDMISLSENLYKMFTNSSISATDHLQYVNKAVYGTASIGTITGNNVENLGVRMQALAWQCLNSYNACKTNVALYFDNEVGDVLAVLDNERIVYGSNVTKADLSAAVTLMQDFIDFMEAGAVTQTDYKTTVSKWLLY